MTSEPTAPTRLPRATYASMVTEGLGAGTMKTQTRPLVPLLMFFIAVTASLLPNFRFAEDYRYFFFACFHAVMLVDLFAAAPEKRWLPLLLGVVPLVLVVRGLAHDPAVLIVDLSRRFGYPLDHANTAGYLFSMSLPIGAAVAIARAPGKRIALRRQPGEIRPSDPRAGTALETAWTRSLTSATSASTS